MSSFRTPEPESLPGSPRSPPGAPRFGPLYDDYNIYATRKSARVAQKQRAESKPSAPEESTKKQTESDDPFVTSSTPTAAKPTVHFMATDFASPPATVKTESRKKDVGGFAKTDEDTIMTGMGPTSINGMLPTPDKTPSSKKITVEAGSLRSVARNLFNARAATVEDVMPSPRKKKGKKLDGFGAGEEEKPIKIYTDAKERIPEIDDKEDNPFYTKEKISTPKPAAKPTKRRKTRGTANVSEHAYGSESMGTNGAVFNFRGKKFWRSFEEKDESSDELMEDVDVLESPILSLPLSKSNEPKWLFGENPKNAREQEEAETDVEESSYPKADHRKTDFKHKPAKFAASEFPVKAAPASKPKVAPAKKNPVKTSTIPKIPASNIPSTTRVTRAQKAAHDPATDGGEASDEVRGRSRGGARSPFDNWSRTRSPMDTTASKIPASNIPSTTRVTRAQKAAHGSATDGGVASDEVRGRSRGGDRSPFDRWGLTRNLMDTASDLGSPTRKPELRARAMRARNARTAC